MRAARSRRSSAPVTASIVLIRDLLDFSSIEGGNLSLTPRPHDVGGLLSEALDALRPTAAAKSQELAGRRRPRR